MEAHDGELELGPIDIVVLAYPPGAPMTGEAASTFVDLVDRGVIRVLDAMFVTKNEDGTFSGFDASDLAGKDVGDFVVFEGASSGMLGHDDAEQASEAIEPGSAAVIIVYENRWAAPFVAAVRRNGGVPIAFQRIPVQDVMAALDAVEAAA
jgi:dihydroorotase-like cyclic amidohydrolase